MPFAGYKDFDACVAANSDKSDPEAYCAAIERSGEKKMSEAYSYMSVSLHMTASPEYDTLPDWFKTLLAQFAQNEGAMAEALKTGSFAEAITRLHTELSDAFNDEAREAVAHYAPLQESEEVPSEAVAAALGAIQPFLVEAKKGGKKGAAKPVPKPGRKKYEERKSFTPSPGEQILRESITILGEAASESDTPAYDAIVIVEGMSSSRYNYPADVLKESKSLLEGRPIYVDHPSERTNTDRSLATKAGWWSNVRDGEVTREDGSTAYAMVGQMNLLKNSGVPWFAGMVRESIDAGHPELVGISILAAGKSEIARDANGLYRNVKQITHYVSADAVYEPGAGGRPISLVASPQEDEEMGMLDELTLEKLREVRPDLFDAATKKEEKVDDKDGAWVSKEMFDSLREQFTAQLSETGGFILESELATSGLPDALKAKVAEKFSTGTFTRAQVREAIAEYKEVIKEGTIVPENFDRLASIGRAGFIIPRGTGVELGPTMAEQAQASLDDFFGNPVDEKLAGKFPKIYSFKEYYVDITGDAEFTGRYNPDRSLFREALPGATHVVGGGTITMTNLLGTSMNRSLTRLYKGQDKWWSPIVDAVPLGNMKQQDRIRLHSFGSLTERTTDGAEYIELDWNETAETYSPTEYGNIVTVGRRAIINDDLRGIRNLPTLLAQSAALTINEYVSNLFTQNSGNGPNLADSVNVFNAASHQGNRITGALNRTNLLALRKVIMKMVNDASKRLSLMPKYLLVPIDLEETAWSLVSTSLDPESANNTLNILADGGAGMRRPIVVPNWTDVNNWYIMADPAQIVCLEMGFLFGRQEPELLSQQDPSSGLVWTNDVLSWKVRWDFGGDWIDYRGAAASVVA
jgi:hypothetical protein